MARTLTATQITLSVTPYTNTQAQIDRAVELGMPEQIVSEMRYQERSRTELLREALDGLHTNWLEWASTFEGETELRFFRGLPTPRQYRILQELRESGVISSYQVTSL